MSTQPIPQRVKDRRFYLIAAVAFSLIVLAGFARTYYLKGFFATPPLPSLLVHVHGVVMTSWVVLFITQVWLVAARRVRAHQRLGVAGSILAGLIVIIGVATAASAVARDGTEAGLRFLVIPLFDMLGFAFLVGLALYYRRRPELHKRLMLIGALTLLSAAIGRIPVSFVNLDQPAIYFGLTDLFIVSCAVYDTAKHRRLHPAFLWGTLFVIASQVLRMMLAGTDAWIRFATALVSLAK
jgi:heme A synthase